MSKKQFIKNINHLYSDFRSDIIAAGIADNGFREDQILLSRSDGSTHQTDKEIISIVLEQENDDDPGTLLIKTNRPGIYDNLPEALFHSGIGLNYSKENIIGTIRRQHKEEILIRKFFSLYEAEIDRTKTEISKIELKFDRPAKHTSLLEVFRQFWPVMKHMDLATANLFVLTLPYVAGIRNDYDMTSQAIAMITGYKISIQIRKRTVPVYKKTPRLIMMKLGVNSALKGKVDEKYALVKIGVSQNAIRDLLPDAQKRNVIETLLGIFLPANMGYEILLYPDMQAYTSSLNRSTPCILGVTARLL